MNRISDMEPHVESRIIDVTTEPVTRERLLEMGLAPGRGVKVLRILPFSGPVIVQAGSLFLALRREEAEQVWVE